MENNIKNLLTTATQIEGLATQEVNPLERTDNDVNWFSSENSSLESKYKDLQALNLKNIQEILELKAEVALLKLPEQDPQILALKDELEQSQTNNAALQQELEKLKKKYNNLKQELQEIKSKQERNTEVKSPYEFNYEKVPSVITGHNKQANPSQGPSSIFDLSEDEGINEFDKIKIEESPLVKQIEAQIGLMEIDVTDIIDIEDKIYTVLNSEKQEYRYLLKDIEAVLKKIDNIEPECYKLIDEVSKSGETDSMAGRLKDLQDKLKELRNSAIAYQQFTESIIKETDNGK